MDVLTTVQAAKLLGVTKRRVLALIEVGRLPAERVGVQLLIKPADLELVRVRKTGRPLGYSPKTKSISKQLSEANPVENPGRLPKPKPDVPIPAETPKPGPSKAAKKNAKAQPSETKGNDVSEPGRPPKVKSKAESREKTKRKASGSK